MRFLLSFLLLLSGLASAQTEEHYVIPPDLEIYTDLRASFNIIASHIVKFDHLPKHPKIIWLDQANSRTRGGKISTEVGFLVRSPGTVKFPPIPVEVENNSIFLRLKSIKAIRNPAPEDFGKLEIFWNGNPEPPEKIHLGEAIEIDFNGLIKSERGRRGNFTIPTSSLTNARWHLFTRAPGQNARADDYFYAINGGNRFFFGNASTRYWRGDTDLDGTHARYRRFRSRIICNQLGTVSGHFGMTLGNSLGERTFLVPYRFEVLPLPKVPSDRAFNTGLVGEWEIESSLRPKPLAANEAFEIAIVIAGNGDPSRRREFDFSRTGFASVDRNAPKTPDSNFISWWGQFRQILVPNGKVPTYPALDIAHFNTALDQWQILQVTAPLTLKGQRDLTLSLTPATELGNAVLRPVLLNLPALTFGAFALAPFLPFLFALAKKKFDQHDPERKKRQQAVRNFRQACESGKVTSHDLDTQLLPQLRAHFNLPSGASTGEVANQLEKENYPEIAALLHDHIEASFSDSVPPIDFKKLAQQLAKITFVGALFLLPLRAASLASANQSYTQERYSEAISEYETLIEEHPGQAVLHRNLALAFLAIDDPARARAACHTALLLDPLSSETRTLMENIRIRLSAPALPGTRLLELRPDQWLVIAATLWVLGFTLYGLRHFLSAIPRWLPLILLGLGLFSVASAFWRKSSAYTPDQFMVLGKEVPREPKIGNPDWNFPPLRSGQIFNISEKSKTHAKITTGETSFWIPLTELRQVW